MERKREREREGERENGTTSLMVQCIFVGWYINGTYSFNVFMLNVDACEIWFDKLNLGTDIINFHKIKCPVSNINVYNIQNGNRYIYKTDLASIYIYIYI